MIQITAYLCDHCHNKVLKTKSGMKTHEAKCFFNIATKSCVTCAHFDSGCTVVKRDCNEPDGVKFETTPRRCTQGVSVTEKLNTGCECWSKGLNFADWDQ